MIVRDVRHALRRVTRNPAFSALVVLTLALGIGANTAIFSVVDSVLLRPLPYRDPDRLVTIEHRYPSIDLDAPVSAPGYRAYRDRTRSFERFAVDTGWGANLTGAGDPVRVFAQRVSAGWFETYGVAPALGRAFRPEEDVRGRHFVAVVSHAFWEEKLGADSSALGRVLSLNGEPYEVVGVMPPGFRPFFGRRSELWVPLALTEEELAESSGREFLNATARLAPGTTLEQAQAEMRSFAEARKSELGEGTYPADWTLTLTRLHDQATGDVRPAVLLLFGAVGFVLLIACANVANLLLARGAGRRREIAIRMAMGASRGQLVRQMLIEATVLAIAGAVLGAAFAWGGLQALTASFDPANLIGRTIDMDLGVLVFTLAIAVATGIGFGLVPALQVAGSAMQETLHEGGRAAIAGRAGTLLRRAFVVAEFGLALSLLAGAGVLIKSFVKVNAVDPGFDPSNLLTANVALPDTSYADGVARNAFFDRAIARIAVAPGVRAVGATSVLPFGGSWTTGSFSVEGYTPPTGELPPWGDLRMVSPGFAEAMRIPLLRGRFFEESDDDDAPPVAVVDEQTVKRYWPDVDPIGRRISFDSVPDPDSQWLTVVGVVGHAAHEGLDADPRVQVYLSYRQVPESFGVRAMAFAIRTDGPPGTVLPAVRSALAEIDPALPLASVETMDDLIERSMGQRRLAVVLLSIFAGLGLTLAATGIYGVMSYDVAQRVQELGVRMALGAGRRDVLGMVLSRGARLAGIGVVLGVLLSLGLTRAIQSQLFGVRATDVQTFVGVAVLLASVGLMATLVPALRAVRLDPVRALRQE
jgi:putative ABC transport system permease protein